MSEKIDTIAQPMLQQNKNLLFASKVITSIGSGIVSGALGLVHYQGIAFMIVCYIIVTLLLYVKLASNMHNTFTSNYTVLTEAMIPFIMTFFFVWTVTYSLVYVY